MPARVKYGLLCDGAWQVHGKWTLQGVFDRVNLHQLPGVIPPAVMAVRFDGPPGAHILRIELRSSVDVIAGAKQAIEIEEFRECTLICPVGGLPLPREGFYSLQLFLGDENEPFGSVDFTVTSLPKGEGGPR